MEKRDRALCLYLTLAITSTVALALSLAYLEIRRTEEFGRLESSYLSQVRQLNSELQALRQELGNRTGQLSERIAGLEEVAVAPYTKDHPFERDDQLITNLTHSLQKILCEQLPEGGGQPGGADDDYYYDPDEYEEEEEEEGSEDTGGGGGGKGGGRHRNRREVGRISPALAPYNLILRQQFKSHQNRSGPMEVKAKIIIDSEQDGQAGYEIEPETQGKPQRPPGALLGSGAAVHLTGDSSRIRHSNRHHCYDVNHRMCHVEGIFRDWELKKWGEGSFSLKDGHLILNKAPGIYYLYAQIFYADNHDSNGYRVYVNGQPVFQCTVTNLHDHRWIPSRVPYKKNSCYTGGLVKLGEGDRIALREIDNVERYSVFEPYKSYFGLFQVVSLPSSRS